MKVPPEIRQRMYDVLALTVRQVFPAETDPATVIKPHVWRNMDYVGIVDDRVQSWYGWSVNCRPLALGFKTVYFDFVLNTLPEAERQRLFGAIFTNAIASLDAFVFLFVTSYPLARNQTVLDRGFVFRQINNVIHPGYLMASTAFGKTSTAQLADKAIDLLRLQQAMSLPASLTNTE